MSADERASPPERAALGELLAELDHAIDEHVFWFQGLFKSVATKREPTQEIVSESAHLLCRFGSWYDIHGKDPLIDQPAFRNLGEEHRKLHDHARWIGARAWKDARVPLAEVDALNAKLSGFVTQARRLQDAFRHAISDLDPLTGVRNRQAMIAELERERDRALRMNKPCAIALGDLDHFKRVNDAHGHAAGDAVLTAAANMYVAHLRPYDLLYRYGGEEFLLCLPGADARTASMVLERLRGAIAAKPVEIGEGKTVAVTSSFGVTEMVSEASLEQTIGRADAALYASKNAGRNRVTVWAPDIAAPRPA